MTGAPLLTFYGDDFTGSSAVMEVLAFAGVPTVMVMDPPGPDTLKRFPEARAIGIAGVARSRPPEWMRDELPEIFRALHGLGAPLCHYKTCSTFDSAPQIGSIGVAAEIGSEIVGGGWHPMVVGAPAIGRYQAFGTLFATAGGVTHRLDRHPVMSRHPVTPMDEADLLRHLSRQTDLPLGLVDLAAMKAGRSDAALAAARESGARIVFLDVIDEETLAEAGRLIWRGGEGPVFALGSQGVEYALVAHWRQTGLLPASAPMPRRTAVRQLLAVSGSCSPITAAQIAQAEAAGFSVIALDAARAVDAQDWTHETARAVEAACAALSEGRSVLAATARGPADPAIPKLADAIAASGADPATVNDRIGAGLGMIVGAVRRRTGIARAVVAGGDTSGHAMIALGAQAIEAIAPLAPGAPLCRLHAVDPAISGLEISLKGGQMGGPDFFTSARMASQ